MTDNGVTKHIVPMNIIKIDGEYIPNPKAKGFTISYDDADYDSGRVESGLLHRACLGYTRKLNLSFPPLNNEQASLLLNAVKTTPDRPFFMVTFPDALEGKDITREMYVGGRTFPAYSMDDSGEILWEGIAFNLITRDVDKV
jgi:hypothetical protein